MHPTSRGLSPDDLGINFNTNTIPLGVKVYAQATGEEWAENLDAKQYARICRGMVHYLSALARHNLLEEARERITGGIDNREPRKERNMTPAPRPRRRIATALPSSVAAAWVLGTLALALLVPAAEGDSARHRVERVWREFEPCRRETNVSVSREDRKARLRPLDYRFHTMGNKLAGKVRFSETRWGRKVFSLDRVEATGADVYVFGGTGRATFNGRDLSFGPFPHNGGWSKAAVKADWLRKGSNEIVFSSGFRLAQDAETAPAQYSFLSRDGGASWHRAQDGEFLVHLRLHRHPRRGTITSPVVDLCNDDEANGIRPLAHVRSLDASLQAQTPAGTSVRLAVRCGPSPRPDAKWSDWRENPGKPARYAQWKATLETADRTKTPVLGEVRMEAVLDIHATAEERRLAVSRMNNPELVRSSHDYTYQRPSARLTELRERFELDRVVAAGRTEFEKLLLLRNWVRRQWPCNDAGSAKRTWDAIEILGAPDGQHGMCVHYGIAFAQCALSLGYVARPVVLTNHFVADVWSNEYGKWVLMDVESVQKEGFRRYGTACYLDPESDVPLDALELHRAVHDALNARVASVDSVLQLYRMDDEKGNSRLYRKTRSPRELRIFRRFGYPLRNNHLDQLEPWEEYHGEDYYHSNLFLWWWGRHTAGREQQFVRHTSRKADLFWTVNRVEFSLTCASDPDALLVTLDTVTPNFECFKIRVDGGPWQDIRGQGDHPDERWASFRWRLKPGRANRFEVKSRNAFGIDGAVSSVVVHPQKAAPHHQPTP